jgi:hypothetical protein
VCGQLRSVPPGAGATVDGVIELLEHGELDLHHDALPPLRCARCGDIIGVYERVLREGPDGILHPSSVLNLDEQERCLGVRVRHVHCAVV